MKTRLLIGAALALPLFACAAPVPPAVTSYAAVACAATPDLARAVALPAGKPRGEVVRTLVDAATPCLDVAGFRTPYIVYAIPAAANRMIDVGGAVEAARAFPPAISILGADGQPLRTLGSDQIYPRGDRVSAQFIPRDGERYILVTVDPALVGTSYNSVATGVSTTYLGTLGSWTSGVDETVSRGRSYYGAVLATVYDTSPEPASRPNRRRD